MYCSGALKKALVLKARTRKLKAHKAKKNESNPSLLLKLKNLKEQVKYGPSGPNVVSRAQSPRLRIFLKFHDLIDLSNSHTQPVSESESCNNSI